MERWPSWTKALDSKSSRPVRVGFKGFGSTFALDLGVQNRRGDTMGQLVKSPWVWFVVGVLLLGSGCSGEKWEEKFADRFFSNGDSINGWWWLRDASFEQVAEWVFEDVPPGTKDLVLDLEVLATSRMDGPPGVDARFFISYGIPPIGTMGGLIVGTKEVTLPNVSPPNDPAGYRCQGRIRIPRTNLANASAIWIRIHRFPGPFLPGANPSTVHVAVRKESVVLLF